MSKSSPLRLQLYNKPQSEGALANPQVCRFHYKFQRTPLIIYSILAIILTALTILFYFTQDMNLWSARSIFIGMSLTVIAFIITIIYAQHITATAVIAVSPYFFYSGTLEQMWRIDWGLLKLNDFPFETKNRFGKGYILIERQKIPVFLGWNLIEIDDSPGLIASIIECAGKSYLTEFSKENSVKGGKG